MRRDWGERLWEYGLSLGIAFQLQDDLLDYTANEADLGKPVLSDLREGKLTLPLILCLPQATRAERKLVETVVKEEGFDAVQPDQILEIVHRLDALDRAHEWPRRTPRGPARSRSLPGDRLARRVPPRRRIRRKSA